MLGPNGAGQVDAAARRVRPHRGGQRARSASAGASSTTASMPGSPRSSAGSAWCSRTIGSSRTSSVLDNVAFGVRATGLSKAARREAARAWVDRLRHRRRWPTAGRGGVSGGQAQRVALARALAGDPRGAAARRTARRARRRHPPRRPQPSCASTCTASRGRRCWSPTTRSTRSCSPTASWCSKRVGSRRRAAPSTSPGAPPPTTSPGCSGSTCCAATRARRHVVSLVGGGGRCTCRQPGVRGSVLVALRPSAISLHAARPEGSARNVWSGTVDGVEPIGDRVRVSVVGRAERRRRRDRGRRRRPGGCVRGSEVWLSAKATEPTSTPDDPAPTPHDARAHRPDPDPSRVGRRTLTRVTGGTDREGKALRSVGSVTRGRPRPGGRGRRS